MQLRPSVSASDLEAFLGAPEQLRKQPVELQLAVASFADTPRSLLEVLVNSTSLEVTEAASLHVNWAGEITNDWQRAVDEILECKQIGQNDRLAVELLKLGPLPISFFSKWVPAERLIQGLRNPHIRLRYRLQLLERLVQEPMLEPRLQVAEAPEAPLSVLEQLAGDLELPVRLAVKFNPSCPPQLIELVEGQRAVASNWNTSIEELAILGQSRWAWIRLAVAQNPSASQETLMRLAQDRVYKIQLAVAKNPATVADVLTALAEHEDKTIQAAVAEHPNVSEEILHQVFPTQKHILKNRKNLPASILERFFSEAPTDQPIWKNNELRYLFLKQPNTPISILAELANVDLEALRADKLAKQSSPPSPEVFEKWIQDDIRFLADLAKHPQVSVEILERLAQYPNPYVQLAVAQNSKIPESLGIYLLKQLLNNSNKDICWKIARDTNTPANILEQIARELTPINQVTETLFRLIPVDSTSLLAKIRNFINNRQSFVNNRQSPEIILFWLRQDAAFRQPILEEWNQLLASLDESENQALQHLAQIAGMFAFGKESRKDMQWLGQNPFNADGTFSSNYILYGLLMWSNSAFNSDDENRSIAIALIGNLNTPLSLREQLQNQLAQPPDSTGSYKHDSDMRLAVAFNPQTPEQQRIEYLQQALSSGWSNIQETVAKNFNTPVVILEQIAQRRAGGIQDVVRNPNAPVNILRQAAQQDNSYMLRLIAENPNTPVDLLEELALNQTSEVRETALKNPSLDNLTVYTIKLKLQDREEVQQAHQLMARRPRNFRSQPTTYQTSSTLRGLSRIYNPSTDDLLTVLTEYAQSENAFVRFITLLHPLTPQDILNQGAESASWLERYAVADNPATSTQIKQHLAKDANRIVRAAATDL